MAASSYYTQVYTMFVGYFGRPPAKSGLDYYADLMDKAGGSYAALVDDFFKSSESTAMFSGLSTEAQVNKVFQNLFGRDAAASGLNYWTGLVLSGKISIAEMAYTIANNAAPADKAVLDAKIASATSWVAALDQGSEILAYGDAAGKAAGRAFLKSVTTSTPATTDAVNAAVLAMTSGSVTNPGQTISLTESADTKVGTTGNDTFNGSEISVVVAGLTATLTALDNLDGGDGTDTLNVTATAAALNTTTLGLTIKNIEVANFQATKALTVDSTAFTGMTNLNVTKSVAAAVLTAANTTDVSVAGGEAAVTVTGGKSVTVTQAMDKAADAITINKAGAVTVTATDSLAAAGGINIGVGAGNAVTGAVTVTSTAPAVALALDAGATASAMDDIVVTGGTTVSVTQNANSVSGNAATNVDNLGDIITQGAVTVTGGGATTSVSVIQSDQVTAKVAVAAAGASQTQIVTFKALVAGNTVTVNGLTFTAAVDLTAEQVAQAFAGLTSGDRQDDGGPTANGIYTGINTATTFTTGAAVGATVTYTEVTAGTNAGAIAVATAQGTGTTAPTAPTVAAGVTGVATVAAVTGVLGVANGAVVIDDAATASITTITVDGYDGGATLGGGGSLDKIATLTLKNSGVGAANLTTASVGSLTLNLTDVDAAVSLDAGGAALTSLTINTSSVASTGAITAAAAKSVTINAAAALSGAHVLTAATDIKVTGTATVDLTGATTNAATLLTIDASGNSGGVTAVLGAANSLVFTGGSGADKLTLAATAIADTKNIDLGGGNDTLTLANGTTAVTIVGTVKGGDGTDTLSLTTANAVTASADGAFHAEVTGFERLLINNAPAIVATSTINLANLAYNYVTVSGTAVADTIALTGMAANGTVAFAGGSTGTSLYTVALADATGTADTLNYVLASTNETSATKVADKVLGTANNGGTITANLVETFNISSSAVDVDGATNVIIANGNSVKTINVSGNAGVNLTSTATTLKTVDASGLTGTGVAGGLVFTANNTSMTVTGGAGNDNFTIAATADSGKFVGGSGNDTFAIAAGADLITLDGGAGSDVFDFNGASSNKSNYAVISNVNTGDTIDMAGLAGGLTTFAATKITLALGATETTQAYLDQAMATLASTGAGWFQLGGNTYVVADIGGESAAAFADATDFVVMIVGLVDLSTASFNATSDTLEIV